MTPKSFVKQSKMKAEKENMLVQLSVGDLQQLIKEAVKEELQTVKDLIPSTSKKEAPELLTREQVCKLLHVSTTTLFNWNRDGILLHKKVGSRVYYQRSLIMDRLKVA